MYLVREHFCFPLHQLFVFFQCIDYMAFIIHALSLYWCTGVICYAPFHFRALVKPYDGTSYYHVLSHCRVSQEVQLYSSFLLTYFLVTLALVCPQRLHLNPIISYNLGLFRTSYVPI